VKLRGYRIELKEIERLLERQEEVKQAVVALLEREGDKRLVGYVVKQEQAIFDAEAIKRALRSKLPEYMVPGVIVELDSMPMTPNGKVDRRALASRELEIQANEVRHRASTPIEEVIEAVYGELLKLKEVDVETSFFELGGHSLLATQAVSRLREAFGVEVSLRSLFEHPSVRELGRVIEGQLREGGETESRIERVDRGGERELSYAQQRFPVADGA
jgi:acyl carrier protein